MERLAGQSPNLSILTKGFVCHTCGCRSSKLGASLVKNHPKALTNQEHLFARCESNRR